METTPPPEAWQHYGPGDVGWGCVHRSAQNAALQVLGWCPSMEDILDSVPKADREAPPRRWLEPALVAGILRRCGCRVELYRVEVPPGETATRMMFLKTPRDAYEPLEDPGFLVDFLHRARGRGALVVDDGVFARCWVAGPGAGQVLEVDPHAIDRAVLTVLGRDDARAVARRGLMIAAVSK